MWYRENGQFPTRYATDQQLLPLREERIGLRLLLLVAFVALPLLADDYLLRAILLPFLILSLAALGLNVLVGYAGQISLGSGAFMAVGAYAAYNLQVRLPETPLLLSLLAGGLGATALGLLVGLPSLRIRGLYLAVATLAAQFFCDWAFLRLPWLSPGSASGSVSVGSLQVLGLPLQTPVQKYLFVLSVVALLTLGVKNLVRGHLGRAWMATRDMDVAAAVIGIRPLQAKLSAFAVSGFLLGVAGALWGFVHLGAWEPAAFGIERSFQLLFIIILGGLGSVLGAFLGAAFIVLLPIALNLLLPAAGRLLGGSVDTALISHVETLVFGVLILVFLIREPLGLARLWHRARETLRRWPFPY